MMAEITLSIGEMILVGTPLLIAIVIVVVVVRAFGRKQEPPQLPPEA